MSAVSGMMRRSRGELHRGLDGAKCGDRGEGGTGYEVGTTSRSIFSKEYGKESCAELKIHEGRLNGEENLSVVTVVTGGEQNCIIDGAKCGEGAEYAAGTPSRDMGGMIEACAVGGGVGHVGKLLRGMDDKICSMSVDIDTYSPGSHHGEQGGDAGGGIQESMLGAGDKGAQALKSKPNKVGGGGLKAKVQFWEMQNDVGDEKLMKTSKSGRAEPNFSRSDRKQIPAMFGQHGQGRS